MTYSSRCCVAGCGRRDAIEIVHPLAEGTDGEAFLDGARDQVSVFVRALKGYPRRALGDPRRAEGWGRSHNIFPQPRNRPLTVRVV